MKQETLAVLFPTVMILKGTNLAESYLTNFGARYPEAKYSV